MPLDSGGRGALMLHTQDKWYFLEYMLNTGEALKVDANELEHIAAEMGVTAIGDHCYNPHVIMEWSNRNNIEVTQPTLEILLGRWMIDHDNWEPLRGWG